MKISKVVKAILFIFTFCLVVSVALNYISSIILIKAFDLYPLEASFTLTYNLLNEGEKIVKFSAGIALFISNVLPLVCFVAGIILFILPKKRGLYGDAELATERDLMNAELLKEDTQEDKFPSVIVGKVNGKFLLYRGQQFLFLAAPTRSGKGVSFVIPNLLHYRDSAVVLDTKGENFEKTAGFRSKCGQEVYKFAPDDESLVTDCWNPMDYVRHNPMFRVGDLMRITSILYPPSDDVWASSAQTLFIGISLYILETPSEKDNFNIQKIKSYAKTLPFLRDIDAFEKYVNSRKDFEPLSDECIENLTEYAESTDKIRGSIALSFNSPLVIFSDPITSNATRKSTFDLRDVRKKRMTIYVVISPGNIHSFGKFLNLFFSQLLTLNMRELPETNPELKYQCLLMLDEFPIMGRVPVIEKSAAFMAGYNMRLMLIFQSKAQLQARDLYEYEGSKSMLTNMALQVIFAPRDDDDAEDYSRMIGDMTEKAVSKSKQLTGNSNRSQTESEHGRAVLLPQEVKAIGSDHALISMENMPRVALVEKVRWYQDKIFTSRANLPLPNIQEQKTQENEIEHFVRVTDKYSGAIPASSIPHGATFEIGFAPNRNAKEVVLSAIIEAKQQILIAAYSITNKEITHALAEKHDDGIDVQLVIDAAQNAIQEAYKAHEYLSGKGVPVYYSRCFSAMHHKFMVIDAISVQLGSFNYTEAAEKRNAENVIYLRNVPDMARAYQAEWETMAEDSGVSSNEVEKLKLGKKFVSHLID